MLYDSSHFPEFCGLHPFPPFVNQKKKIPLKDECAILGKKKSVGKDFLTIWNLYTNKVALFFKRSTWNAIFYPLKKKNHPRSLLSFVFQECSFWVHAQDFFFPQVVVCRWESIELESGELCLNGISTIHAYVPLGKHFTSMGLFTY